MKSNHDDDPSPQSSEHELGHDTERATDSAPVYVEPEHGRLPDTDAQRTQEFDEQVDYADPHQPEPLALGDDASELSAHFERPSRSKESKRTRRLVAGFALLVVTIAALAAVFYTLSPSRSVKVNVSTKQPGHIEDATAKPDKAPDDVTAEAIAEVRSAMSKPSSIAASVDPASSLVPRGSQDITAPLSSSVLPTVAADETPAEAKKQDPSAHDVSRRNQEQSIRFPGDDDQAATHRLAASVGPDKGQLDGSSTTGVEASAPLDRVHWRLFLATSRQIHLSLQLSCQDSARFFPFVRLGRSTRFAQGGPSDLS